MGARRLDAAGHAQTGVPRRPRADSGSSRRSPSVLVLAATSTAVLTSGPPAKSAPAQQPAGAQTAPSGAPAPAATATSPAPAATAPAATGTSTAAAAPPPQTVSELALTANPGGQLAYNTKQLSAKAGVVTIKMTNISPLEHNVTIAQGCTVLGATPTFTGGAQHADADGCDPAPTRSTARCPAIVRRAWKVR